MLGFVGMGEVGLLLGFTSIAFDRGSFVTAGGLRGGTRVVVESVVLTAGSTTR